MLQKKKVFVCEDDDAIVEIINVVLGQNDYKVDFAMDGKTAIEKIVKSPPDLILIDLWLPLVSGEEIVKKIRTYPRLKKIPIILFSASREIKIIADRLEIKEYLSKPFDILDLEEKVNRLLSV